MLYGYQVGEWENLMNDFTHADVFLEVIVYISPNVDISADQDGRGPGYWADI